MRLTSTRLLLGRSLVAACVASAWLTAPGASVARAQAASGGTIAGLVTDASSRIGLAGVMLQLDGTRLGGTTGATGRYRLTNVPAGTYVVVARRIGYNPQRQSVTVTVGSETTADFVLQPSPIALDQVVVTGTAGVQERRSVGNAVTSISAAEELSKSAAPDLGSLLNARAAGVTVVPRSGRLGAGPNIQIRGRSSLSLDNGPLIYVDGVRVNNATGTGPQTAGGLSGQGSQIGGRLNDINPEDIESIEVIKGPAASTIYGTEAANGVVQIITKKGAIGATPQVSIQVEQGSLYFRDAENRIPTNYYRRLATDPITTWNGLQAAADSGRAIYKTGQTRRYSGSLSGGRDQSRYYLSSSYENDIGIEPNNTLRQFGFHANLSTAIRPTVDLATSLNFVSMSNRLGADFGASGLLGAEVGHIGLFPATRGYFGVPPEVAQDLYDNRSNINRFTGSATLTNRPATWFVQRAILGLDYSGEDARNIERFAAPELARYLSALAATGRIGQTLRRNSLITADYSGTARFALTDALTSSTSLGGQFYKTEAHTSFLGGTGFPGAGVETVSAASAPLAQSQTQIINTTIGAYAEQQFGWRDRLFVTAGLRVDNNSAFGDDFKWVTYPKVSASWVVNEEPFWGEGSRLGFNTLRLRSAYGESGRQPNAFSALRTFQPVPGPGSSNAVTPNSLGNPDLRPERGKELEVGFEAGLFNRVTLDFTYFNKRTVDVIVSQPVAPSVGFPGNQLRNLGRVDNGGIELSATVQALQRQSVSWEIVGKLATNDDEIRDLGGVPSLITAATGQNVVGYPIGGVFARRVASADRNATTGLATNVLCQAASPSDAPVACATAPFHFIGTQTPRTTGALSSTLTLWQNLRLYALADFKRGHVVQNTRDLLRCSAAVGAGLCEQNYYPERFTPVELAYASSIALTQQVADYYYEDASFVKLREVSATYTLPARWVRSRTSLTLSGRELYTWTKFRGLDPEANANNAATTANTSTQAVTPSLSRLVATVNIAF
jgi:TonB-linked SusC/RagA family outer membrane protein